MIRSDLDLLQRILAYTHTPLAQRQLKREWDARQKVLAVARDCEALAAAWQALADELREAAG